ncbi:hypothetical protein [Shewanella algae]|uniref:hypothetical protein n=2 Tax=Shewanella TaxID=22 RepID=UPI0012DF44B3|nr:hypothetical protein [Shewanella algae]MBZ4679239.1 hypothetical protein [Shewanella sp.]QGS61479.1 hypothetical protein GMX02_19375 [Shewanella algae]
MNETILTSLGSAGLVRRARKALEKSQPQMQDYGFEFEGQKGLLDWNNPLASRCDCGASGLCKHIVAAALYLLEQPASPETRAEEPPRVELHLAELLNDAGKAQVRRLYQQSQRRWAADIKLAQGTVCVELQGQQLYFRCVQGLQDIICTEEAQRYALLAVWLYCREQAIAFEWPQWLLDEQAQLQYLGQQSRDQLKRRCLKLLEQMTELGIERLRPSSLVELELLLVPMDRQNLPLTALKQLHGTLEKYVSGQGVRDRKLLLSCLARSLAALEGSQPQTQRPYQQAPEQVLGLGAFPWQSEGGAHGVTQVLQDEQGRFITLAESRPKAGQQLDYVSVFRGLPMLAGAPSALGWQGKTQTLAQAELNAWGRLRRLQDTRVYPATKPLEPVSLSVADEIDWQQEYLCFRPSGLYLSGFNQASQCMELHYWDREQALLSFSLPYNKLSQRAVTNLELLGERVPELIVARIERTASHLYLRPVSLLLDNWFSLFFDTLPQSGDQQLLARALVEPSAPQAPLPRLGLMQQTLHGVLDELADGLPAPRPTLAQRAERLGLMTLSHNLKGAKARDYLRAAYCAEKMLAMSLIKPVHYPEGCDESKKSPAAGAGQEFGSC